VSEQHPAVRAGDAERDATAVVLRDHLVAGRLTLDEFIQRVEAAHDARTLDDLAVLTRDLPAVSAQRAPAAASRKPTRWVVGVMSGVEKKRRWRVPESLNALAVMGGVVLDLRNAEISSAEVEINAVAIMGGVEIVVPEGVEVEVTGLAVMGAKEESIKESAPLPGAPFVRVRVFALMGAVEVKSKPSGRPRGPLPPLPPLPR